MDDRRNQLEEIIYDARNELSDIKLKEKLELNKQLVGKCFKYHNCYSCPKSEEDYWWVYRFITHIDENGSLWGIEFEEDKYHKLTIETKTMIVSNEGWKQISKKVFLLAWDEMIEKIKRLN